MSAPALTIERSNISWAWATLWTLMLLGAIFAAGNAVMFMTTPGHGSPEIQSRFFAAALAGWAHTMGGALAALLGPFQLLPVLRRQWRRVHVWLGRIYLVAVLCGALGGLYFAPSSEAGPIGTAGFTLLALAWIHTAVRAYTSVRARNIAAHRRWMIRNYALTFAAATLRVELILLMASGVAFLTALQIVAWLCWVPNWLVVEAWIRRRREASSADLPTAR